MVVWTVYLGVLVGYKYTEPALIPPTLPSACPLHHPLSCSSCSCCPSHPQRPTNPQSPVLVVLVRCPGGPGGNKRSCSGRNGHVVAVGVLMVVEWFGVLRQCKQQQTGAGTGTKAHRTLSCTFPIPLETVHTPNTSLGPFTPSHTYRIDAQMQTHSRRG